MTASTSSAIEDQEGACAGPGDCEKAVAYGIAIEAVEEKNRSLRTHHSIGPCVFNELFLFTSPRRDEPAQRPSISLIRKGSSEKLATKVSTLLSALSRVRSSVSGLLFRLPLESRENSVESRGNKKQSA
jgi:hypothetical protein